jgi:lipopolysaccharide export system protein LptC
MGAMMERWLVPLALLMLVGASTWWLVHLEKREKGAARGPHEPDSFMEGLTRTTMDANGRLKERLFADRMEHFPDDDSTELVRPRLELYNPEGIPWHVTAEHGWVEAHGDKALLKGHVRVWRKDPAGRPEVEVFTNQLQVYREGEYAETKAPTTIKSPTSVSHGIGMRYYLKEERLILLSKVKTHYEPHKKSGH